MFKLSQLPRYGRIILIAGTLGIFYITIFPALFKGGPKQLVADMPQTDLDVAQLRDHLRILKSTTVFHPAYDVYSHCSDLPGFNSTNMFRWTAWQPFSEVSGRKNYEKLIWSRRRKPAVVWEEETWASAVGTLTAEWERTAEPMRKEARKKTGAMDEEFENIEKLPMNVKGDKGSVMLKFEEEKGIEMQLPDTLNVCNSDELETICKDEKHYKEALVREITAIMTIKDGENIWELRVHGVHWPRAGLIHMITTSKKFAGIFGLPAIFSSGSASYWFTTSSKLLSTRVEKALEELKSGAKVDKNNPWTAWLYGMMDQNSAEPHCEYAIYMLLHPAGGGGFADEHFFKRGAIDGTETESGHQEAKMSLVILSPNCGFYLESTGG